MALSGSVAFKATTENNLIFSWAAVNRYAWARMDELGRQEPKGFVIGLPHEYKSPCDGCLCEKWCDTPCSLRLKWWDARIGRLRRGNSHAAR